MAQEIERKFLVKDDVFKMEAYSSARIAQGYLSSVPERTVRIRVKGDHGYITVKGINSGDGTSRYEWEKEIPEDDARALLDLCEPGMIDKTRWFVEYGGHTFEVDEFHGDNEGLVVAELELTSCSEPYSRPDWLGDEVTGDKKYYNSELAAHPFRKWQEQELLHPIQK